ncbi:MAG: hypothetical protein RSB98_04655 [Raoultibacter sp.]
MKKLFSILLIALLFAFSTQAIGETTPLAVNQEALDDYGYLSPIREAKDCTRKEPLTQFQTVHFVLDGVDVYMKPHRCGSGDWANSIMKNSITDGSPSGDWYVIRFRIMTVDNGTDTEIDISSYDFSVYDANWSEVDKAISVGLDDSFSGFPGSFGRFSFADNAPKGEIRYVRFCPNELVNKDEQINLWIAPMSE